MLKLKLMSHRVVPKLPRSFVAVLIFGLSFTGFGCDLGTWGKLAVVSRISPPPHEKDSVEWLSAVAAGSPMPPSVGALLSRYRAHLGKIFLERADVVYLNVNANANLIEEALAFGPIPPAQMALLSKTTTNALGTIDFDDEQFRGFKVRDGLELGE